MAAKDLYEKDYYQILGVSKGADGAAIKKQYRKLARELHPDKTKGDKKLEGRFKAVSEAYDILSDDKKRREYDEVREAVKSGREPPGFSGGGQGFNGGDFSDLFGPGGDIFSTLLQMLDDGHLTDGLGRKINFKNCLIIMTSNIGVRKLQDFGTGVGFKSSNSSEVVQEEQKRDILKKELSKFFAPEYLNRIDPDYDDHSLAYFPYMD